MKLLLTLAKSKTLKVHSHDIWKVFNCLVRRSRTQDHQNNNNNNNNNKNVYVTKHECEICPKYIKTEAVFTKIEMNNKWNVNLLQNTNCDQNSSKLKQYLPRQKWTINETLIFFGYRLDHALDTLNWLTPLLLKKNLPKMSMEKPKLNQAHFDRMHKTQSHQEKVL